MWGWFRDQMKVAFNAQKLLKSAIISIELEFKFITYTKEIMLLPLSVNLSVCLSVRRITQKFRTNCYEIF